MENVHRLKGTSIFTYDKTYYKSFKSLKKRLDGVFEASIKAKLGYINSVLAEFALRISSVRKCNVLYYVMEHIGNVTEIIDYRLRKGVCKLCDRNSIFRKPAKKGIETSSMSQRFPLSRTMSQRQNQIQMHVPCDPKANTNTPSVWIDILQCVVAAVAPFKYLLFGLSQTSGSR